jgi:hypothetical protein
MLAQLLIEREALDKAIDALRVLAVDTPTVGQQPRRGRPLGSRNRASADSLPEDSNQ